MKKLLRLAVLLGLAASVYGGEFYSVNVTRVDQDLYRDTATRTYIRTQYCYEYVYYQDAVLVYTRGAYDNHLVFDDGTTCQVRSVFK